MSEKVYISTDDISFENLGEFIENNNSSGYYDDVLKLLEAKSKAQDIDMRKRYAEHIFTFVSLYMFGVFFILVLSGSPSSFKMSDTVLVTLLGTTTANVIGVLVIVAKYLFPKK